MGITKLMIAMCELTGSYPTMFRPTKAQAGILGQNPGSSAIKNTCFCKKDTACIPYQNLYCFYNDSR